MTEQFKPIPGHPGYFIGDRGRVRKGNATFLTPTARRSGTLTVAIQTDGKRRIYRVARLVYAAFCGECSAIDVHHIDGDRSNCGAKNLYTITRRVRIDIANAARKTATT
jgi:hypothetical protein